MDKNGGESQKRVNLKTFPKIDYQNHYLSERVTKASKLSPASTLVQIVKTANKQSLQF